MHLFSVKVSFFKRNILTNNNDFEELSIHDYGMNHTLSLIDKAWNPTWLIENHKSYQGTFILNSV